MMVLMNCQKMVLHIYIYIYILHIYIYIYIYIYICIFSNPAVEQCYL